MVAATVAAIDADSRFSLHRRNPLPKICRQDCRVRRDVDTGLILSIIFSSDKCPNSLSRDESFSRVFRRVTPHEMVDRFQ